MGLEDQAVLHGIADQLGIVAQFHLLQDMGPVGADRFDAPVELGGDLGHRFPRGDHGQDLMLAVGKALVGQSGATGQGLLSELFG